MNIKKIIPISLILLVIVLFIVWCYFRDIQDVDIINAYFPNFITEILGILITVLFINWLFEKEKGKENKKYRMIAYKKIATQIYSISELFLQMYKASSNKSTIRKFLSYDDFFNEDNLEHILKSYTYFDFKKEPPELLKKDWFELSENLIKYRTKEISSVIDNYLPFLDVAVVEKLEKLKNNTQLLLIKNQNKLKSVNKQLGIEWRNGLQWHNDVWVKEIFSILKEFINEIESETSGIIKFNIDNSFWADIVAPRIGSARFTDEEMQVIRNKFNEKIK